MSAVTAPTSAPSTLPRVVGVQELAAASGYAVGSLRNAASAFRRTGNRSLLGGIGAHARTVGRELRWPADVVERWLRGELESESEAATP